ncbi:MAG: T9SS C-terminal target domain-containing protein [Balneolaceae bacterium]|nr:MAG: T9SS C-terminal target domain-containing protein [Balneolaceae bacterium]
MARLLAEIKLSFFTVLAICSLALPVAHANAVADAHATDTATASGADSETASDTDPDAASGADPDTAFLVVINEFQSSNNATIADEDGDYEDWIELYNTSNTDTARLDHVGLSDDADRPFRWVLPPGTYIPPNGHLLVWASGKDRRDPQAPLHAGFSIASDGEPLLLTHPTLPAGENRIDQVPPVPLPSDVSYGRQTDGADIWTYFDRPTPGKPNASSPGYGVILPMPEPSHQGGFHPEPFTLSLASPGSGVEIRYTLDGSTPDEESERYTGPIPITDRSTEPNDLSEIPEITHRYAPAGTPFETVFKGTVVRARAFRDGDLPGPVMTETYFIHPDGHARYTFPVVTVNTDREHFFDHDTGIYVLGRVHEEWLDAGGTNFNGGAPANYNRRGEEWERPAHFALYETDGTRSVSQDIGVRIHGGWSRAFPHKSLRLYSRSDYGESRFRYRFFEDLELDNFNRLILRGSGQDQTATMFRDVYTQESVRHMNFDIQHFRPVVTFLNGEYWGIYNIRQRYDRFYFETHYDVWEEELDLLTNSAEHPKHGSGADFIAMRDFIREEDLSDDALYAQVARQMDIENFIDYYIANIFADNTDWPHNNIDFWRKNHGEYRPDAAIPEHDGRWRWVLVDTDFGFGWLSAPQNATMSRVTGFGRQPWSNTLLNGLLENRGFRDAFFNRFADMLNTTFLPERMTSLLDSLKAIYAPEILEHINRRGDAGNWRYPRDYEEWVDKVDVIRRFAERRPGYMWDQLAGFDEQDTFRLMLDVAAPVQGYPAGAGTHAGTATASASGTASGTASGKGTGKGKGKATASDQRAAAGTETDLPADDMAGHGFGTITVNSITIDPSTEGIEDSPWPWNGHYFSGIPVRLSAEPEPGFVFVRWREVPDGLADKTFTFSTEPVIDITGAEPIHLIAEFRGTETAVPDEDTPAVFVLYPNYPNPFNPSTTIRFALPEPAKVRVDVFDITGRHVVQLLDEYRSEGHHRVAFDSSVLPGLASGVYLYKLQAGPHRATGKMLLLK